MSFLKRVLGLLLVLVSLVSLIGTVVITVGVWNYRKPLAQGVDSGLALAKQTLQSTDQTLVVVDETLETARANVQASQAAFQSLSATVETAGPALEATSSLLAEQMPQTLRSAQEALEVAGNSAKTVDGTLEALSAIPLLGIRYRPENSLGNTLSTVGKSLEGMPEALEALGTQLEPVATTLPDLAESLNQMGASIALVDANLVSAQKMTAAYQGLLADYVRLIETLQGFVPALVTTVPAVITFFAFWLAVVQFLALLKGWEWLRGPRLQPVPVAVPAAAPVEAQEGSAG